MARQLTFFLILVVCFTWQMADANRSRSGVAIGVFDHLSSNRACLVQIKGSDPANIASRGFLWCIFSILASNLKN